MRECICGKAIVRRKERGGREREYCCDKCRQQAYRERHKRKLSMRRAIHESSIRMIDKIDQEIRRESWQDDLERKDQIIQGLLKDLDYNNDLYKLQESIIDGLEHRLANAEAEIVRLNTLLDSQSKRHPHSH